MEIGSLRYCFGCGKENPVGLHLENKYIGDKSHIEFEVKKEYCGHPGLLHGGVTCIIFDELMFWVIARLSLETVTLSMTVDYKNPALEGDALFGEAWIEKRNGRKVDVRAIIIEQKTGKIIAEAKGKYLEVDLARLLDQKSGVNLMKGKENVC